MLRVDLDATDMKAVLSGRVWEMLLPRSASTSSTLSKLAISYANVYPRLELGMVFYDFSADVLDTWESLLRRAVLRWTLGKLHFGYLSASNPLVNTPRWSASSI